MQPMIIDNGTMDTAVSYKDRVFVYSSEFRFSFSNDNEFLDYIADEIAEEYEALETMCL